MTGLSGDSRGWLEAKSCFQTNSNLSQLHHHVCEHVQEAHHGVPEATVRQTLLVSGAGSLGTEDGLKPQLECWMRAALPLQVFECGPYLDVLGEAVEHLFSYRHGFGEVSLSLLLDDILARVVPVEVTDGFLWVREGMKDAGAMLGPSGPWLRSHGAGLLFLTCSRRR